MCVLVHWVWESISATPPHPSPGPRLSIRQQNAHHSRHMMLLVTPRLVPVQHDRFSLVRLLSNRICERQTGRHVCQSAFQHHGLFEVEQDSRADDAVDDSSRGTHKSAELRLGAQKERKKIRGSRSWGQRRCGGRAYRCQRENENRGECHA